MEEEGLVVEEDLANRDGSACSLVIGSKKEDGMEWNGQGVRERGEEREKRIDY